MTPSSGLYKRLLSASHYNLPRPPPHLEIAFESYSACPDRFLHIAGDDELYAQRVINVDTQTDFFRDLHDRLDKNAETVSFRLTVMAMYAHGAWVISDGISLSIRFCSPRKKSTSTATRAGTIETSYT